MECDRAFRERAEAGVHWATARADRGGRLSEVRVALVVVRRQGLGARTVCERTRGDRADVRDGFGDVVGPLVVCVRLLRVESGEQL